MWRGLSVTDSSSRKGKGDKEGNGEGRESEGVKGKKVKGRKGRKGKGRGGDKKEEKRRRELYIYVPLKNIPLSRNRLRSGLYCFLSPCMSYQINFFTIHESYYVAYSFNKSCSHFEMITKVKIVHKNEQVRGLHILPPLMLPSPWSKPQHFLPCWMLVTHNWWEGPLLLPRFIYKPPQQRPHSVETSASFMKQLLAQPPQAF